MSTDNTFSALDYIEAVVLVADANGNIVYINKAVKRILGYEPYEIVGDGWWNLVTDSVEERRKRKDYASGMAQGIIDVNERQLYETKIKTKNGEEVVLQWTYSSAKGNYLVGAGQVITEKKLIEEKLDQYAKQVALLHKIDKQILSILPLETRIESVLIELEKNISFVSRATLAVFDNENEKATLYRKGSIKNTNSSEKKVFPIKSISSANQLSPGKYLIAKDLRKQTALSETDIENLEDGICSYLSVPLFYRDELMGALFLCSAVPDPFNELDIELAKDVASSLTLALEQNRLEQSLIKKNAEKELLLKEIHHRVKNNLQVISSLLNLQSSSFKEPEMLEAFQKSKDRIYAMALIHTKLYESGNLSEINFEEYMQQLVSSISASYSPEQGINWQISAKEIRMSVDVSINLGLIITELVTNSLKHAFNGRPEGTICIEVSKIQNGKHQLKVSDNGKGLPADFEKRKMNTLGLEIVDSLVEQIEGKLQIESDKGACFTIQFTNTW